MTLESNRTYTLSDGATFRMEPYEEADDPRTQDQAGTMVFFHKRYNLGDTGHGFDQRNFRGWAELKVEIEKRKKPLAILPVYMMDHSGLDIRVDPSAFEACDPQHWDWGQIGFIFVTRGAMQKMGWKLKDRTEAKALETLRFEVEEYDQWHRGDVYGYIIEKDGEQVDSCWGYYGPDIKKNGLIDNLPEKYREELRAINEGKKAA